MRAAVVAVLTILEDLVLQQGELVEEDLVHNQVEMVAQILEAAEVVF